MITSTLAEKTNTSVHTIRHYARIGLLNPVAHSQNNYKIYSRDDEERLRFINAAKNLGFTLAEIAHIFAESDKGNTPCPLVRDIVKTRIDETRRKIKQLQKMQKRMENALGDWEKMENRLPDGNSVCHLIESISEIDSRAA
jgi:DNA-binding transcriptional MerR regulator